MSDARPIGALAISERAAYAAAPRPSPAGRILDALFGRDRSTISLQLLFLAAVAAIIVGLGWTVAANLQRFGIGSGFDFLQRQAGFDITQRLVFYSSQSTYGRALLIALLNTITLSICVIALATILGTAIGLIGLSSNRLASGLAVSYIEIVRNIPLLLHILFWYFAVLRPLPGPRQGLSAFGVVYLNNRGLSTPSPEIVSGAWVFAFAAIAAVAWAWRAKRVRIATGKQIPILWPCVAIVVGAVAAGALLGLLQARWDVPALAGFNVRGGALLLPEFVAMTASLSVYGASFIAEIVRGGIASVPKGQSEAARSLGLRAGLIYRLVILPQALRVIIPPLTSAYLDAVKNSSLGAFIAYPELMLVFGGTVLNQTNQALEVMTIIILVYLAINLVIAALMNRYNRAMLLKER